METDRRTAIIKASSNGFLEKLLLRVPPGTGKVKRSLTSGVRAQARSCSRTLETLQPGALELCTPSFPRRPLLTGHRRLKITFKGQQAKLSRCDGTKRPCSHKHPGLIRKTNHMIKYPNKTSKKRQAGPQNEEESTKSSRKTVVNLDKRRT